MIKLFKALLVIGLIILAIGVGRVIEADSPPVTISVNEGPEQTMVSREGEASDGDWISRDVYIDDVIETSDQVAEALSLVGEAANMTAYGEISMDQFAQIMDTFRDSLRTHYDYFNGAVPPEGYESSQELMLRAFEVYDEAAEIASRGARTGDLSLIEEATLTMLEGSALIEQATASLPGS